MLSYIWRSGTPLPAARNTIPASSCAALDCWVSLSVPAHHETRDKAALPHAKLAH